MVNIVYKNKSRLKSRSFLVRECQYRYKMYYPKIISFVDCVYRSIEIFYYSHWYVVILSLSSWECALWPFSLHLETLLQSLHHKNQSGLKSCMAAFCLAWLSRHGLYFGWTQESTGTSDILNVNTSRPQIRSPSSARSNWAAAVCVASKRVFHAYVINCNTMCALSSTYLVHFMWSTSGLRKKAKCRIST